MKSKRKFTSLFLAGLVVCASGCIPSYQVMAATIENVGARAVGGMSLSAKPVSKSLKKGDRFNVFINVDTDQNVDELRKAIRYIELEGSTKSSVDVQGVQIMENEGGSKTIVVMDLTYNGKGKSVEVEVGYTSAEGKADTATTSIVLENAEAALQASEGISLSTSTLNVVAGQTQQITLTIKNDSKSYVEAGSMDLKIKDSNSAKGITLKKKKIDLSAMDPGSKKDYYITLDIDEKVTRGIHEMEVKIGEAVHTVKLKVDSNFIPPSLEVSVNNGTAFEANVAKTVQVNIKNVGQVEAKNVKLEIVPNEKVFVADGSNVKYIENIGSNKAQSIPVSLIVNDTTSFNLPVEMKLSYIDDLGETKTNSQYIYLSTKGSVSQKAIEILTTKEPTGLKKVGEAFNVGFKVTAPDEAKNVKIEVKSGEGIVSKSKSIFIEPKLTKGQSKSYLVDFVATQSVTTGTYPIEISADYTLNGKEVSIKQYATVSVQNEKDTTEGNKGKGKPKVIVGNYSSTPVVVRAGEEFDLEIGFLNTSSDKKVQNLKANLTVKEQGEKDTGSVFTPVGASNTFFISQLSPGEMDTKKIRLYTLPSAKPKTYEITLEMEYEDDKGEAITATERFGIPVEQVTKLEVAEVRVESTEVGRPTEVSATIYNTGKTDISNVRVKTVGEGFEVQDNTLIIGSLEKGNSKTYMPTITPLQEGNLTGKIQIEYEDVAGQVQNYEYEFQMDVTASMTDTEGGMHEMLPPLEEEKQAKWPIILGIVVGIGSAAGITGIVMKKRKQRLESEEDED